MKFITIKRLGIILLPALFFTIGICACKKDNYKEVVGVCPKVISTNPGNLATNVPLNQIIEVTFNENINPASITQATFTIKALTEITGTITYNSANATMRFAPTVPLAINTTYTGTVNTSIRDFMGQALQAKYVWTFSTGTISSPVIISTDPVNLATNVPLNKIITANFNMPMDPLTINGLTFNVKQGATSVAGTVTYSGNAATFTPSANLLSGILYTATITTSAKSVGGIAVANNYVWTFTTSTTLVPIIISTDPPNLATNVPLNKIVTANFNEAMNPLSITGMTYTVKQGATPVAGTVTYAGTTATFTPSANLLSGITYTATVTTGAMSASGIAMANNHVWTFTTSPPLGPIGVDLKTAARFGIISGTGVSNNAGFSVINNMDVGISPGARSSITGFPPATIVNGAIYASDDIAPPGVPAMLAQAKLDLTNAYLFAAGASSPAPATVSGDQGGLTLAPGIYKSNSTLLIQAGDLTLDGKGNPNAVWIFQIASGFTTVGGAGGNVILINGAQAKNIYWQVGSSATIGDFTTFNGNVLALTSITMNSGAVANGRMLAINGAVVMTNTNIINKP